MRRSDPSTECSPKIRPFPPSCAARDEGHVRSCAGQQGAVLAATRIQGKPLANLQGGQEAADADPEDDMAYAPFQIVGR